ncbi:MAG: copper chaperone Copz family protein [Chloroflexi bacterium]|nr:copper chaperone Copz family protein [Chloroflexota bacterium]
MTDSCCCPPEAGNAVCELPAQNFQRLPRAMGVCPECGKTGKPVQGQTVKALLSVSLREVRDVEYLFCRTQTCSVVYFSPDGKQVFTVDHFHERVYQKEPDSDDVFVCYCFRHTLGEIRIATPESRAAIVEDINVGINAGQCACDLRNPQGSCCLGNVRGLIKRVDASVGIAAH